MSVESDRSFVIPPDFAQKNDEAFDAVLRGEKPAMVPIDLMVDSVLIMEIGDITADDYFLDYEKQWKATIKAYHRFGGMVPVMPFYYPCVVPTAIGRVEAHWEKRSAPMIRPFIRSEADVDRLRPPKMGKDGLMEHHVKCMEYFVAKSEETGIPSTLDYGSVGPNDIAALMMGPTEYFIATKTNPDLVHKLLTIITDVCIEWFHWRIQHFGEPMENLLLGNDYSAYHGPEDFAEFVVPYIKSIVREFSDKYHIYHCDGDFTYGNVRKVLDLDLDMFYAFSPRLDIGKVRQILGPEVDLAGNVDPIGVMVMGSPDDVLRESKRCIEAAGKNGHFVLCPGGGVGAGTKLENIDAMVQASIDYSHLMA